MGSVNEIADMKERVAATGAILSAAALEGHERDARLVTFLETVEKSLVQKQQQIIHLEEEQSRALEEIERLKNLLNNVLTTAENTLEHGFGPAPDDLEQRIDRLDAITSEMTPDIEEGDGGGDSANEPDPPPVRKRRVKKVLALFSSPPA